MKKLTALLLVAALIISTAATVFAADFRFGGGQRKIREQGQDGWYVLYTVDQIGSGAALDPTIANECVWYTNSGGDGWNVPAEDLLMPDWVEDFDQLVEWSSLWTNIQGLWEAENTGEVQPWGAPGVFIIKWVPAENGVYDVNVLIRKAGNEDRDESDGSYISVFKNNEQLYFKEMAPFEWIETPFTAFEGPLELATTDALYFALDTKGDTWDDAWDDYVQWDIQLTRTGDYEPAVASAVEEEAPPAAAQAVNPPTGENTSFYLGALILLASASALYLAKKKLTAK